MLKPKEVKIIQIIYAGTGTNDPDDRIYGLGDDSKVYVWLWDKHDWALTEYEGL